MSLLRVPGFWGFGLMGFWRIAQSIRPKAFEEMGFWGFGLGSSIGVLVYS